MSKKILAMLLALALVFAFAACAKTDPNPSQQGGTTDDPGKTDDVVTYKEGDKLKIACITWGYADSQTQGYRRMFEYLTKELDLNIEWTWAEAVGYDEITDVAETLIQGGINGIITYGYTSTLVNLCTQNNVYFMSWTRMLSDIFDYASESPYFCGNLIESKEDAAAAIFNYQLERGAKEIALLGPTPGTENNDIMVNIMKELCEENSITYHEYRGEEMGTAMQNMIALYPNLDGVVAPTLTAGYGDQIIGAIRSASKEGQIVVSSCDLISDTEVAFQDGSLGFCGGGMYAAPSYAFIIMINKMMGSPLTEETAQLAWPYIYFSGTEGYDEYMLYVEGDVPPFTAEEFEPFLKWRHPEASYQDFYNLGKNLSLEDIKTRHASYFE